MSRDEKLDTEPVSSPEDSAQSPNNDIDNDGDEDSKTPGGKKRGSKSSKPRLTAVQKNTNHKDAENKRRNAIRERFTELSQLVPDAAGQERSEQVMLQKTKTYLQDSIQEIRRLELLAQQQGIQVPEDVKLKDSDYLGSAWKQPNLDKYEKSKLKKQAKTGVILDDLDAEGEDD